MRASAQMGRRLATWLEARRRVRVSADDGSDGPFKGPRIDSRRDMRREHQQTRGPRISVSGGLTRARVSTVGATCAGSRDVHPRDSDALMRGVW